MPQNVKSLKRPTDPWRTQEPSQLCDELETFAARFAYPARREVRRLMRSSARLADLATVFPGAIHALATKRGPADVRTRATKLVEEGAALKSVARLLELPLWLRRLPPEAFHKQIEELPNGELSHRQPLTGLARP
jgi:hypothetical protein